MQLSSTDSEPVTKVVRETGQRLSPAPPLAPGGTRHQQTWRDDEGDSSSPADACQTLSPTASLGRKTWKNPSIKTIRRPERTDRSDALASQALPDCNPSYSNSSYNQVQPRLGRRGQSLVRAPGSGGWPSGGRSGRGPRADCLQPAGPCRRRVPPFRPAWGRPRGRRGRCAAHSPVRDPG